jgi:hypothetical protein
MAWIWCGTAGVLRLNTPAELLGLSGSIFLRKMVPWFCRWWWNRLCRKHTKRLIAILWHQKRGAATVRAMEEILGIKWQTLSHFSSANSTELHDMLTCQADVHYLHMELESSLSNRWTDQNWKRHVCKIVSNFHIDFTHAWKEHDHCISAKVTRYQALLMEAMNWQ